MEDNILPEPVDGIRAGGDHTYRHDPPQKPKTTFVVLIIIVLVALLSLLAGFTYDYLHTRHQDNVRKQDLTYVASQAETFYNFNHYYPTLAQFNSSAFAALQPQGLNKADFKDPSSSGDKLTSAPSDSSYAYEVSPAHCNNIIIRCAHFQLVATLSNASLYKIDSRH
jgi:Tfp pilus assembly protein PilE